MKTITQNSTLLLPTAVIPLARCQNRDGHIHAVTADLAATFCKRVNEYAIIAYDLDSHVTCGLCRSALTKHKSVCSDCGIQGKGSVCPACREFQQRNSGQRRGRQRKPAECTFLLPQIETLYRRYQNNESMNTLSAEVGVCGHTLKRYFRESGFSLRSKKKAGKARASYDRAMSPAYLVHPQAKETKYSVSPAEDRLLIAIQQLNLDGIKPTAPRLLACTHDYASIAVLYDVLGRLRRRGFLDGLALTGMCMRRELRPAAPERMAAVYQPGMHCGDLSRSAGVSATCANNYIKALIRKTS